MTEDDKRIRELAIRHAAIELRVPRSGDDKIDAMILESLRLDLAGQAMQGMLASSTGHGGMCVSGRNRTTVDRWKAMNAAEAYAWADAILTEWRNPNAYVQPGTENPSLGSAAR